MLATVLYGALTLQTYVYYQHYPTDRPTMKSLIAVLWIMNTFHMVLLILTLYHYLIRSFGNYEALAVSTWELRIHVFTNCFIAFLVQLFFACRVWRVSEGNRVVTGSIIFFACSALGFGSTTTIKSFSLLRFTQLPEIEWIVGMSLGSTAVCDILITMGLCYLLNRSRTHFKRTDSIINTLIAYSLCTGLLTTLFALVNLATFMAMPTNMIHLTIGFFLGKLYTNSLLATLNMRKDTRAKFGMPDIDMELRKFVPSVERTCHGCGTVASREGKPLEIFMQQTTNLHADSESLGSRSKGKEINLGQNM
ncbi:hypothetical protein BD410DRAFT_787743 [Rickenella mellea]|uniref:DUF6534 domain-containing protein n=1 Tax=Rickenella mellea TaxID=50990 RepID=A0A4Y7Q6T1_9AGAM|nr:hypothetical protein BD410DRAFT_787743 [Rickenella mellea]